MTAAWTTRCCSALALISCCGLAPIDAQPKSDRGPLLLFPTRPVWTLALNNQITAPPAYDATRAFFSIDGDRVVCYELLSGTQLWIANLRPTLEPVAGDGLVFIVDAASLTALRAEDGTVAWLLPLTEPLAVRPVWDNGWLIVSTSAGSLLAFRAIDGQLIWNRDLGSPAHAMPALAADRVYVSTEDRRVVALNVADGTLLWERRLGGPPNEILALDDRVYVGAKDHFFYCLMTRDGRVDWRWRIGGDIVGVATSDENNVYFVAQDNVLRALNRKSGGQQWLRPLPFRPVWAPVHVAGTILVAGLSPSIRAYKISDGTSAGEVSATAEIASAAHVVENAFTGLPTVLIVTHDIKAGAAALLITRTIEPASTPLAPPNPPILLPPLSPTSQGSGN